MSESNFSGPPLIAAVFATMSRPKTARGCILALARQTRPPELVVVAANDPADGTVEALERFTDLPFDLVIHRMLSNRGNAGGVEEAMDIAFRAGAAAVWILDDDSWPRETALEAICRSGLRPDVVKHAQQVDPATGRLTWPLPFDPGDGRWKMAWEPGDLPATGPCRTRAAWTGAVIPREIHDRVGPVNGELFIRGEDEEYPWRISQAGFEFELVIDSVLTHPGPRSPHHWHFLGKSFFFEENLEDWKLYYKIRNMVWLKRRQAGIAKAVGMALSYLAAVCIIDGVRRIPLFLKAVRHGWTGKLGKL